MTKLSTTLLKDLPIKQTSITDEDYVVVSSGGTKKLKVKDITKDIELSDDKKKEIRVEAEKEAKHSDEPLEKIIERKENEVKDEIRAVAKDIVHYKDVMTKLSALGIPDRYLSRYTPLMRMKLEYDSSIRKAESMGCKVGEDCFIKKSVSILEVRLEQYLVKS